MQKFSSIFDGAVQTMETGPGDGAGTEVVKLFSDVREEVTHSLQIKQQKQNAAVTWFTLHGVRTLSYRDLILLRTGVTLLPRQPIRAGTFSRPGVTGTSSTVTFFAAISSKSPVPWGTVLATEAIHTMLAITLAAMGMTDVTYGGNVTVAFLTAYTGIVAIGTSLTRVTALACHSLLAYTLPCLRITRCRATRRTGAFCAVFGPYGISIVPRSTNVALGPGCVEHAPITNASQGIAVTEKQVRIGVAVAVARLTGTSNHQRVSKITRSTAFTAGSCIASHTETLRGQTFVHTSNSKIVRAYREWAGTSHTLQWLLHCGIGNKAFSAPLTVISLHVMLAIQTYARPREALV